VLLLRNVSSCDQRNNFRCPLKMSLTSVTTAPWHVPGGSQKSRHNGIKAYGRSVPERSRKELKLKQGIRPYCTPRYEMRWRLSWQIIMPGLPTLSPLLVAALSYLDSRFRYHSVKLSSSTGHAGLSSAFDMSALTSSEKRRKFCHWSKLIF